MSTDINNIDWDKPLWFSPSGHDEWYTVFGFSPDKKYVWVNDPDYEYPSTYKISNGELKNAPTEETRVVWINFYPTCQYVYMSEEIARENRFRETIAIKKFSLSFIHGEGL